MDYSPLGSSVLRISHARILNGFPFCFPGDLPDPGIGPMSLALAGGFFTSEQPGKSQNMGIYSQRISCIYCLFPYLFGAARSELLRGCFPNCSPQFSLNKTLFCSYYRVFIGCLCKHPDLLLSPLELIFCFDWVFSFMFFSPWGHKKSDISD